MKTASHAAQFLILTLEESRQKACSHLQTETSGGEEPVQYNILGHNTENEKELDVLFYRRWLECFRHVWAHFSIAVITLLSFPIKPPNLLVSIECLTL